MPNLQIKGKYRIKCDRSPGQSDLEFTAIAHRSCIPPLTAQPGAAGGYIVLGLEPEEPDVLKNEPCHFCGKC